MLIPPSLRSERLLSYSLAFRCLLMAAHDNKAGCVLACTQAGLSLLAQRNDFCRLTVRDLDQSSCGFFRLADNPIPPARASGYAHSVRVGAFEIVQEPARMHAQGVPERHPEDQFPIEIKRQGLNQRPGSVPPGMKSFRTFSPRFGSVHPLQFCFHGNPPSSISCCQQRIFCYITIQQDPPKSTRCWTKLVHLAVHLIGWVRVRIVPGVERVPG